MAPTSSTASIVPKGNRKDSGCTCWRYRRSHRHVFSISQGKVWRICLNRFRLLGFIDFPVLSENEITSLIHVNLWFENYDVICCEFFPRLPESVKIRILYQAREFVNPCSTSVESQGVLSLGYCKILTLPYWLRNFVLKISIPINFCWFTARRIL